MMLIMIISKNQNKPFFLQMVGCEKERTVFRQRTEYVVLSENHEEDNSLLYSDNSSCGMEKKKYGRIMD